MARVGNSAMENVRGKKKKHLNYFLKRDIYDYTWVSGVDGMREEEF